jgi:hypothetical protein
VNIKTRHPTPIRRTRPSHRPQTEDEWWAHWWYEDYSWEGLLKKPWSGFARAPDGEPFEVRARADAPSDWIDATIQDYWRNAGVTDADLIECADGKFSKFHLPYRDENGSPTEKCDWSPEVVETIAKEIGALIQKADPVGGAYRKIDGADTRAQLDGIVLPRAAIFTTLEKPRPGTATSKISLGASPGNTISMSAICVTMRRAHLTLDNHWRGIRVAHLSDFGDALFKGDTDLSNLFSERTLYLPGVIVAGSLVMPNGRFGGGLQLREAVLDGGISLANSTFEYDAVFEHMTCKASFHCWEAKFKGNAQFGKAIIRGDVAFRETVFSGIAGFAGVEFLSDGNHASTIAFIQTKFERYTTFSGATLSGDCSFSESSFKARTDFSDLKLTRIKRFTFESAIFDGPLSFSGALIDSPPGVVDRAFLDVALPSLVDCTGVREFDLFSVFDGASPSGRIDFHGAALKKDRAFKCSLARAEGRRAQSVGRRLVRFAWRRGPAYAASVFRRLRTMAAYLPIEDQRDARLRALEGGCRTVKLSAESVRDRLAEQLFYRYELIARRGHSATPAWERFVSRFFAYFSDYGASIVRPLSWLLVVWIGSAVLYWAYAAVIGGRLLDLLTCSNGDSIDPSVFEAVSLSGEAMFRPFFMWASRSDPIGSVGYVLLSDSGPGVAVGIRIAATLQSFASILLIFLSALAIRRRFQIT